MRANASVILTTVDDGSANISGNKLAERRSGPMPSPDGSGVVLSQTAFGVTLICGQHFVHESPFRHNCKISVWVGSSVVV